MVYLALFRVVLEARVGVGNEMEVIHPVIRADKACIHEHGVVTDKGCGFAFQQIDDLCCYLVGVQFVHEGIDIVEVGVLEHAVHRPCSCECVRIGAERDDIGTIVGHAV